MANHHPRDHRDMLQHVEASKGEKVVVKKPDWIVHESGSTGVVDSAPATPLDVKKSRMGDLLAHNAHTPSNGSFTPVPAPYKEDGASVWERDGTAKKKKKKKLCFPEGEQAAKASDGSEEVEEESEEEEEELKENDPRWNIKRRSPVKRREGEFEKDFRSRQSYSGKKAEEEGDEEEEKEGKEESEKEGEKAKEEKNKADEKDDEGQKPEDKKEEDPKSADKPADRKVKVPKHLVSGPLW